MVKRRRLKGKLDLEDNDDEEEEEERKPKSVEVVSSDDEEANEDLSLKIVEKHLLMRAARLNQDEDIDDVVLDGNGNNNNKNDEGVVDLSYSSFLETETVVAGSSGASDDAATGDAKSEEKRTRVGKKKKKVETMEIGDQSVIVAKEEHKVETVVNGKEAVKAEDMVENVDLNAVEMSDNIVMRKLLRGPRYFDPPDNGWQTCYNCGEEGHMAVNCTSALKRKKPCFICGSFEHGVKQCAKAKDCFICKKGGHRAKDCPEKHKNGPQDAKICLKCGDSGHDMISCRNCYSLDDLKEIQCYICKSFGHLCCANFNDLGPREVSCFRCGGMGHTGLACARLRGETTDVSPSSCYRCGEEGHFARECASSVKVGKRNFELSTPTWRPHKGNRDYFGVKSVPHDLGKARKKLKTKHKDRGITTPRKSKQRGGWITDDPGDISYTKAKKNLWRSPATPSSKGHKISTLTSGGHISSSKSPRRKNFHHGFTASRFDNRGSDGMRRNDNW